VKALLERLESAHGRGAVKRLAASLTDDEVEALQALLRSRGIEADPSDRKRLVRLVLDREADAQMVGTITAVDEAFRCQHCGLDVPPHGRTARNHCPRCLRSLHVDDLPGDRACSCHGIMDPVRLFLRHADKFIEHRCRRCGFVRNNRALEDGAVPDDPEVLLRLSAGILP
jgi:hypothetical protein